MQTLRKLPTIEPNTKAITDQRWNGTEAQTSELNIGLTIDVLFERLTHHVHRRRLATPEFEGFSALIEQHTQSIGRAAAGGFGRLEQQRLCRTIDHVINRARPAE